MKKTIALTLALLAAGNASAQCVGSGAYQVCNDPISGNSYNINRIGPTTIVNGSNPRTGSTWNQTSQDIGNMTITNGRAADGNTWNSTTHRLGSDSAITSGTDSRGNAFSCTTVGGVTVCN